MSRKSKNSLLWAKQDKSTSLAGLFRPINKTTKRPILDVTWNKPDGTTIQFFGREVLSGTDLRFLLGIISVAGSQGNILEANNEGQQRLALETENEDIEIDLTKRKDEKVEDYEDRVTKSIVTIGDDKRKRFTVRQGQNDLLSLCGLEPGGKGLQLLRASLKRMSSITVWYENEDREGTPDDTLMGYQINKKTKELKVTLNWLTSEAVMADLGYTRIEMSEVRAIKSDNSLILHNRLCAIINQGQERILRFQTLYEYLYPEETEEERKSISRQARNKRKKAVTDALDNLNELERWQVEDAPGGSYKIIRIKTEN